MTAIDLMTNTIPPLRVTDTGENALSWMDEFKVSQLPVVDNGEYMGLISDSDVLEMNDSNNLLGTLKLSLKMPFVIQNQHFFDVIKIIGEQQLSLIPVLDEQMKFVGIILQSDVIKEFANLPSIQSPGGVIVLELNNRDYALSEIAKIVESNDAKIICLHISSILGDNAKFDLTLKISQTDLSSVIRTFERYNYTIKHAFHEHIFDDDLKDRYKLLMNFLKM